MPRRSDLSSVQEAMIKQMGQVSYVHSLSYGTEAAEALGQLLVDSSGGEMARAFIVSSGSEAMEAALKLARQYHLEKPNSEPARSRFIARHQSYHGNTLGALGVSGHVARRAIHEPILAQHTSHVSPCYAYRHLGAIQSEADYVDRLARELDDEFERLGPNNVAAFIAEPVVGAALGCVLPSPGYFKAVQRVCHEHGALLILDEVMCGSGRIGPEPTERFPDPLHAWQDPLIGIVPDIMTMGKSLGGGYMPVAGLLASHRVVDVLARGSGAFAHGQTYQGHPLACKAALAVQTIVKSDSLVANVRRQGELLGRLLREQLARHPNVGDVRGKGLFWAIEIVKDKSTKEPFDAALGVAMGVHELGMEEPYNISLYPGAGCANGRHGDHVMLAPAYIITAAEVHKFVRRTVGVICAYFDNNAERLQCYR